MDIKLALAQRRPLRHHGRWSRLLRRGVVRRLRDLRHGSLIISESDSQQCFGDGEGPTARIVVHDPAFWSALAFGGGLGAGQAYVDGLWDSPDLVGLVRLLARNRPVLQGVDDGLARLLAPARRLAYALRSNTRRGSRANILAHYDLGEELFAPMLDADLHYSSAIFPHAEASLEDAQRHKCERLAQALDLRPGHAVLEIGTGWGGLASHLAREHDIHCTTTTISDRQHAYAAQRFARQGLDERVTLHKRDYRDLTGRFDRLVSVEMIEAVGHAFYETFFRHCDRLLVDDGLLVMQAITIDDAHYDRARREVDFIKRFVFPGSCIPSVLRLNQAATRASSLRLLRVEDYTPHYARTLAEWRRRFRAAAPDLAERGFDDTFRRLWEYYLSYCEGGFAERAIGLVHLTFAKPDWRAESA